MPNEDTVGAIKEMVEAGHVRHVGLSEAGADTLRIEPGPLRGAAVETYDDHRIAMSFALAGLRVPGLSIRDPGCAAKTWPGFGETLEALRTGEA